MFFTNFAVWASIMLIIGLASSQASVHTVHVVFSCHLDVGFGIFPTSMPGLDSTVLNTYFHVHFPKAIRVAEELRSRGGPERLVFLTHSWLASLYLDCPAHIGVNCPNSTQAFEAAVQRGDITWHALPHNAQTELYDPGLLEYAVQLTHELDAQFGVPSKQTMSQRDVPGLTRAAIPILHGQGVRALSVGVNGVSAPPGVPKNTPFWWRDQPSGTELLAFWHPGGYSGTPVDSREECIHVAGFDRALCMAWRQDNEGPPSAEEVVKVFQRVRGQFPGSKAVVASGFDEFVGPLLREAPRLGFPVVTGEIGDTWIYGVGSDPGKISEYRELLRVRGAVPEPIRGHPSFKKFSRLVLKVPEHTWGVSIGQFLADWENWGNTNFHAQLEAAPPNYNTTLTSWLRQRSYARWAVEELGESQSGIEARQALEALQALRAPPKPTSPRFERADISKPLCFASHAWSLELDGQTGAIVGLQALHPAASAASVAEEAPAAAQHSRRMRHMPGGQGRASALSMPGSGDGQRSVQGSGGREAGASFASRENPLAEIVYSTYSEDDFVPFWNAYAYVDNPGWLRFDFGKPNATVKGGARRADVMPTLEEVWHRRTEGGGLHVITKARLPTAATEDAGAPQAIWTEIRSPTPHVTALLAADARQDAGQGELLVDIIWENKTATRLPEALWVRWRPDPAVVDPSSWVLYKLGQPISPLEVIRNGSHSQHAVGDEGVAVRSADGQSKLSIRSLDAVLVSPGDPTPFPNLSQPPDLRQGMAFALTNNIWGTNYPAWVPYQGSDANMRFRFAVRLGRLGLGGGGGATGQDRASTEPQTEA